MTLDGLTVAVAHYMPGMLAVCLILAVLWLLRRVAWTVRALLTFRALRKYEERSRVRNAEMRQSLAELEGAIRARRETRGGR